MALPYFPSLVIGGKNTDLSHLNPFTFNFLSLSAKKNLRVHVTFKSHAFSKKYIQSEHPAGDPIIDKDTAKPRTFCPTRYRLSFDLPKLILSLNHPKVKVWQTASRRNWTYSIKIDDPEGPYHIFFEIRRPSEQQRVQNTQDLNLIVESAYHEDADEDGPNVIGSIGFYVLCSNVYLRKPTATKR